jgi:hypothetical protein
LLRRTGEACGWLRINIEEATGTCYTERNSLYLAFYLEYVIIVITWFNKGKTDMADGGKKDKGKKENQKKALLSPKEKRKLKKDKKKP